MKKIFLALFAVLGIALASTAQESKTLYVIKKGKLAFQSAVSGIDSIIFYTPVTSTTDEGVVINGIKWATRNINAPGTFTANPEDAGMFYQWNRMIGWSATDPMVNSNGGTIWDDTTPEGTEWAKANDPSPAGWRVPTFAEILLLLDTDKVNNEWTTENGVNGVKFTDKATGNTLFLPAAGDRLCGNSTLSDVGLISFYWSSTQDGGGDSAGAYNLGGSSGYAGWYGSNFRCHAFSVRAVAENPAGIATFKVTVPESTPVTAFVGIVGNWGSIAPEWTPGAVIMQRQSDGTYALTKDVPAGFEYKYVVSDDGVTWSLNYCEYYNGNRQMPVNLQANDLVDSWSQLKDEGVIINGVKWATRNVDAPGTFAGKPEDPGMFYQWNRPKAWPATGDVTDWDNSYSTDTVWEKANDPSPAGWRVPTSDEIKTLFDTGKVSNVWTTQNNVIGIKFTDIATGNSLFLSAAGYRDGSVGALYGAGSYGFCWSSTVDAYGNAYSLYFTSGYADCINWSTRDGGQSVRAVAE